MDRFLRKPFWFFLRIFSISGSLRLNSMALYMLAAWHCICWPVVLSYFKVTLIEERGGCSPLYIRLLYSGYIWRWSFGTVCRQISLFSILLGLFYQALQLSYLKNFLSTTSCSSCVNCPSLMSSRLQMIFVIGSSVTLGDFPSRFLKCCFNRYIRSSWLEAFCLALVMLFLLLTSFNVCHAILDCLSSTDFLILLIWSWMYSVCSFRYALFSSLCAFLSFWTLPWVVVSPSA